MHINALTVLYVLIASYSCTACCSNCPVYPPRPAPTAIADCINEATEYLSGPLYFNEIFLEPILIDFSKCVRKVGGAPASYTWTGCTAVGYAHDTVTPASNSTVEELKNYYPAQLIHSERGSRNDKPFSSFVRYLCDGLLNIASCETDGETGQVTLIVIPHEDKDTCESPSLNTHLRDELRAVSYSSFRDD